jgi:O-acetyl-ADP-ribose deacetylase (regulator of RNase III)
VDILLLQASVLNLPSSKRASVVIHDGTQDLRLWRPPGRDRDLWDAYGADMQDVLDKERKRVPGGKLPLGGLLRLHPGKLHCDFLVWIASRGSHGVTEACAAPSLQVIEDLARRVIEFVAEHDVVRVAFPALGAGPGEADAAERMAAVVRAVAAYKQTCFAAERPTRIEEVIVCDANAGHVSRARRMVDRLARAGYSVPPPPASIPVKREASARKPATSASPGRGRAPRLDPAEVSMARARSKAYDRVRTYNEGDWLIHPTFGVGQVRAVKVAEKMVVILFENGEEKTLIHAR